MTVKCLVALLVIATVSGPALSTYVTVRSRNGNTMGHRSPGLLSSELFPRTPEAAGWGDPPVKALADPHFARFEVERAAENAREEKQQLVDFIAQKLDIGNAPVAAVAAAPGGVVAAPRGAAPGVAVVVPGGAAAVVPPGGAAPGVPLNAQQVRAKALEATRIVEKTPAPAEKEEEDKADNQASEDDAAAKKDAEALKDLLKNRAAATNTGEADLHKIADLITESDIVATNMRNNQWQQTRRLMRDKLGLSLRQGPSLEGDMDQGDTDPFCNDNDPKCLRK